MIYILPCALCPTTVQVEINNYGGANLPRGWSMACLLDSVKAGTARIDVNYFDGECLMAWCPECWPAASGREARSPRHLSFDTGVG